MNNFNRKLSPSEAMYEKAHRSGGATLVFTARIDGMMTAAILRQALQRLQQRHWMLQVHFAPTNDGVYFQSEGTSQIPLRVIETCDAMHWQNIAEAEVHQTFGENKEPLCRVTALCQPDNGRVTDIIATFHHAICDALSGLHFLDHLLMYCQKLAMGDTLPIIAAPQVLPPLENLLSGRPLNGNWLTLKFNQIRFLIRLLGIFKKPKLVIEQTAARRDRRTHCLTRCVSADITTQLKKRCRQEGTTVHGALCAAMLLAAANIAREADKPVNVSCATTISLRRLCEPEVQEDYMGCIADGTGHTYTLQSNTDFWDLARESKSRLSESIRNGEMFMNLLNFGNSNQTRQARNQKPRKQKPPQKEWEPPMGRIATVMVANAGQVKISGRHGTVKLREIWCLDSVHTMGPCFGVNVVTLHGRMFCTFPYVVPLLSHQTAAAFVASVMSIVQAACLPETFTMAEIDTLAAKAVPVAPSVLDQVQIALSKQAESLSTTSS